MNLGSAFEAMTGSGPLGAGASAAPPPGAASPGRLPPNFRRSEIDTDRGSQVPGSRFSVRVLGSLVRVRGFGVRRFEVRGSRSGFLVRVRREPPNQNLEPRTRTWNLELGT